MENKYRKRSHISDYQFRRIVQLFCQDLTATQIASLTDLNRKTINRIFTRIRCVIVRYSEATSPLSGEIEIDESYFGPRRVRGVRVSCNFPGLMKYNSCQHIAPNSVYQT